MDDSTLIELYWNRTESAVAETNQKYGRYCFSIANRILNSPEDSEECVNDTWLKTWNAIPPTRPTHLRAFLGKITRNLSLNRLEANHSQKRGGGEIPLIYEELAQCTADPAASAWSADRSVITEVLNIFLEALPEQKRMIFVKRYWYMEPVAEIAAELGITESNVKMTLLRQREKLAKLLREEEIDL